MSSTIGQGQHLIQGGANIQRGAFEYLKQGFTDVDYTNPLWSRVLPPGAIDTSINPGSDSASYNVRERVGMASVVHNSGTNIPTVGFGMGKATTPIEFFAVSCHVSDQEARKMQNGYGYNMLVENGRLMQEACGQTIDNLTFNGQADIGFNGMLNQPNVAIVAAAAKAGGGTAWTGATADEILADINAAIGKIYEDTNAIAIPGQILLPTAQYALIVNKRLPDTNISVIEYLQRNNLYSVRTSNELDIQPIPYLKDAAAGGAADRMIVKVSSPTADWLPFPEMPTLQDQQRVELTTRWYCTFTMGAYTIKRSQEAIYVDGI